MIKQQENYAKTKAQYFQEGREACINGIKYHQNPYKCNTGESNAWSLGWVKFIRTAVKYI